MADELIHKINDAADALSEAKAMVWAAFFLAEGQNTERSNSICSCSNEALIKLNAAIEILDGIARGESKKAGA